MFKFIGIKITRSIWIAIESPYDFQKLHIFLWLWSTWEWHNSRTRIANSLVEHTKVLYFHNLSFLNSDLLDSLPHNHRKTGPAYEKSANSTFWRFSQKLQNYFCHFQNNLANTCFLIIYRTVVDPAVPHFEWRTVVLYENHLNVICCCSWKRRVANHILFDLCGLKMM